MMEKLTFKQYYESKKQLREAIKETPQQSVEYTVYKYCKLVVGENKEEKEQINLKPNQKIRVEWLYETIDNPTPLKICFEGLNDIDPNNNYATYWQGSKLQQWLARNTREETP